LDLVQKALLFRHALPAVFTVTVRPSARVGLAMSSALPNACSEIGARELPFMPRQE
jgi:hypothetical protein